MPERNTPKDRTVFEEQHGGALTTHRHRSSPQINTTVTSLASAIANISAMDETSADHRGRDGGRIERSVAGDVVEDDDVG